MLIKILLYIDVSVTMKYIIKCLCSPGVIEDILNKQYKKNCTYKFLSSCPYEEKSLKMSLSKITLDTHKNNSLWVF